MTETKTDPPRSEVKCKACAHYDFTGGPYAYDMCLACTDIIGRYVTCKKARASTGDCGIDGRLFLPAPPKPARSPGLLGWFGL